MLEQTGHPSVHVGNDLASAARRLQDLRTDMLMAESLSVPQLRLLLLSTPRPLCLRSRVWHC